MERGYTLMDGQKARLHKKGMTLVELIVVMAIMSVVLGTIYTFFIYNMRLYRKSNDLSQVQFDVRTAVDVLSNDLRNISEVSLTDSTLDQSYSAETLRQSYPSIESVTFTLNKTGMTYLLAITISGNDASGRNDYEISTNIILNNIQNAALDTGPVLYYNPSE